MPSPIKIVFCYARKDELLLNKLKTQLSSLEREGLITMWHDRDINAGEPWEHEIDKRLDEAGIILLLISPDFMNSDYCYSVEMKKALERRASGESTTIPVILRPTDWQIEPLKDLQVLPKDAKPVTRWNNRDEAFLDIAQGIRKVMEDLATKPKEKKTTYEPSVESEKQILQQMAGVFDFRQAIHTRDWQQAERILQKYSNLPEAHSLLGLGMSQEVQEYFSYQLHPDNPSLGGTVTQLHVLFDYIPPAPSISEAIHWLEEALRYQDNPEGKVTAALALMYGYSNAYDHMIDAVQEALTINPSLVSFFQIPGNFLMLVYACDTPVLIEEVARAVSMKLPEKEEVQAALKEASDPHKNRSAPGRPFLEWYAVELGTRDSSRMPIEVRIIFPTKDGSTYAQISRQRQKSVIIPAQTTTTGIIDTLMPVDEILEQLTMNRIVLISLI